MIYEYLKTAFPFYDNLQKQNRFVKPVKSGHGFLLNAPQDRLLPFILAVPTPTVSATIDAFVVINADTEVIAYDILSDHAFSYTINKVAIGKTYIVSNGNDMASLLMAAGVYYAKITINGIEYFSELFKVHCFNYDDNNIEFTRLEWNNDGCDLGEILYQTGFTNVVFLTSTIAKEDPQIEEEGFTDGLNNFYPSIQKYIDNLSLEDMLPFYLADALVLMSMHKKVLITLPQFIYSSEIRNIKTNISQQDGGHAYLVTVKFQQETQYVNTSCCNNMELIP